MKNGKAELSLDQRIAAALKEDQEHSSDFLAGLLDEIDTAIDDCEGPLASIQLVLTVPLTEQRLKTRSLWLRDIGPVRRGSRICMQWH
jgi:hypothetical protein